MIVIEEGKKQKIRIRDTEKRKGREKSPLSNIAC
jgi:hypothetical protein